MEKNKKGGSIRGRTRAYSELLVFLIGGSIATLLLLIHLLSGDHRLLVNFALGHFGSGLGLLLVVLALLLWTPAGAGVNAGLVAVALAASWAHAGARIGDPRPDAGLLTFQKFPMVKAGRD